MFTYLYAINALNNMLGKFNDRIFQRLEPYMQEHLFSYFSMTDHDGFLKDVSITLIDRKLHSKQWFRTDVILKTVSKGCFCVYFFTW